MAEIPSKDLFSLQRLATLLDRSAARTPEIIAVQSGITDTFL
jgi:hypothetical protein